MYTSFAIIKLHICQLPCLAHRSQLHFTAPRMNVIILLRIHAVLRQPDHMPQFRLGITIPTIQRRLRAIPMPPTAEIPELSAIDLPVHVMIVVQRTECLAIVHVEEDIVVRMFR